MKSFVFVGPPFVQQMEDSSLTVWSKRCGTPCTFSFENILCRLNWTAFQGVDSASLGAISTPPPDEEGEGEDALKSAPFPSNDNILPIGTYWFPRFPRSQ